MSLRSRKPVRMLGGVVQSGNLDTGEIPFTRGGQRVFCLLSGAILQGSGGSIPVTGGTTGHAVWYSGAGRLNTIVPHQAISGVQGNFYDSVLVARSGVATIGESGYRVVGVLPANTFNGVGSVLGGPNPINVDVPFYSGLAASLPSGCAGVTFTISPEAHRSGAGDEF